MTESLGAGQTSGHGHRHAQRPMAEGTQGKGGRTPGGTGPQANGHRDGRHTRHGKSQVSIFAQSLQRGHVSPHPDLGL